ncbi:myeloid differentiation primary response protein MyD88 [Sitophilus oryzae]|uniref:Myeloid differentiation primary response protein MyD88 n=1 Tax=Sitophilus oryzae TaxID=7048 RepID=A0A6J2Y846_SITOR|nr:myeloid differentiation primary response protein MyD88 [Sitophilus oryzae]XP_030759146.1 myeloid differentiation primary response protein MyD88 [Sitophilus oryzae]
MDTFDDKYTNSIRVLRANTINIISNLLNPKKYIKTEQGLLRDWEGLADLCGIAGEVIPNISVLTDPTSKVLQIWQEKSDATIKNLLLYFTKLDRDDVVDDILPYIDEDIIFNKDHSCDSPLVESFDYKSDELILTTDDRKNFSEGLELQRYDAFVLFEDDDISFATLLIDTLENTYNLKLCVRARDLLAGNPEHESVIKLITERCGRVIVIISPEFLKSNVNKFFYSLTQSISIEQRQRKIIPCIYKECGILPPELNCYVKLDFRKTGPLCDFWDKLYNSIKISQNQPKTKLSLPENSLSSRTNEVQKSLTKNLSSSVLKELSNGQLLPPDNGVKHLIDNNISNSVTFSQSMSNLPDTTIPQDNIVPSTSVNSVGKYEEKHARKSSSFTQKIKKFSSSLLPKSNSEKKHLPQQNMVDQNVSMDIKDTPKEIKPPKKEKKFSFRKNKKKNKEAVLADT